jgi:hypothetical protein
VSTKFCGELTKNVVRKIPTGVHLVERLGFPLGFLRRDQRSSARFFISPIVWQKTVVAKMATDFFFTNARRMFEQASRESECRETSLTRPLSTMRKHVERTLEVIENTNDAHQCNQQKVSSFARTSFKTRLCLFSKRTDQCQ